MMSNKAIITIMSKQDENEDDIIEVVTPGKFYKKNDHYYAIYEETEISGMKGTTTTLKIYDDNFSLIRNGTTNTKMVFKKDLNDIIMYNTPNGTLELMLSIDDILINVDDNGGEISAKYDMAIAGQESLSTELVVKIKTDQTKM